MYDLPSLLHTALEKYEKNIYNIHLKNDVFLQTYQLTASYVNNVFTIILIITEFPFDVLYSDPLTYQLNKYIKSCIIFILTFDSLKSDHLITALNKLHIRSIYTIIIMSLGTLLFIQSPLRHLGLDPCLIYMYLVTWLRVRNWVFWILSTPNDSSFQMFPVCCVRRTVAWKQPSWMRIPIHTESSTATVLRFIWKLY
jgi:hypothetical protein